MGNSSNCYLLINESDLDSKGEIRRNIELISERENSWQPSPAPLTNTKQRLITRASFVYKSSRLVRISLINAVNKIVLLVLSGKLFYKSNRKRFSCVCTPGPSCSKAD